MAENSKIEWTDHTFNPWTGCTKVSPACDRCYAEAWAKRAGAPELWQGARRRTTAANWRKPLAWNKAADAAGRQDRVFCASLADVFDNQVPTEWRADLWSLIAATPHLDWLLLTKRPQNIAKMLPPDWGTGWPNVWLGTTVENQDEAERRIAHLAAVPHAVRFLSCEPLLGPLDLTRLSLRRMLGLPPDQGYPEHRWDALRGKSDIAAIVDGEPDWGPIHWVIAGGESGPGARPMHPDWVRGLRDQCQAAGVPFFMKQMGGVRKPHASIPDDLFIRESPNA